MTELLQTLMDRDNLTQDEAMEIISDMVSEVLMGADPEDVLYDEGLEPDYVFDLLDYVEDSEDEFDYD